MALRPILVALAALGIAAAASALTPPSTPAPPSATTAPATGSATPSSAAAARIAAKRPGGWIVYEDATYTPVLDEVTRALADARSALTRKDYPAAAKAMNAAGAALATQAERAAQLDRQRAAADLKLARDTRTRLAALVTRLDSTATLIAAGKIPSTAALDDTLNKASRADLEQRWLVSDVTMWYPVVGETHWHLRQAMDAYLRKDFKAAATEARKAAGYVRLEVARATGASRDDLIAEDRELARLAARLDKSAVRTPEDLARSFARVEHALALAHRSRAAEAWVRKAYDSAGYELEAAARNLEGAAGWIDDTALREAHDAAADAHTVGDKLAAGGVWTRDEVAKGFAVLGHALNAVGARIGRKGAAKPVDVGG